MNVENSIAVLELFLPIYLGLIFLTIAQVLTYPVADVVKPLKSFMSNVRTKVASFLKR